MKVLDEKDGVLSVAVPPYRVDVQREADLIEDILRIYGYNNVEIPRASVRRFPYAPKPDRNRLMNLAADYLSANGFYGDHVQLADQGGLLRRAGEL